MKVLLIEDEAVAAERLKKLLLSMDKDIEILSVCNSITASVEWLSNHPKPDIIFMDIELSDGRSFEIFKKVKVVSPVIFTTAYDKFALDAIKNNALDYLLKPIDKDELRHALTKYKEKKMMDSVPDFSTLFEKPKKLAINLASDTRFIDIDDIEYLKADSNYTHIFTVKGEKITTSHTLGDYENMLAPYRFLRVHNAYIINPAYVLSFNKTGGYLIMHNGSQIKISRYKNKELLALLSLGA